jgi:hypothetical protein
MGRVVVTQLLTYLHDSCLITKQRNGFLARRSTLTNLIESLSDWVLSIENKMASNVICIGFTKAFDLVPHTIPLQELESYGVQGSLNSSPMRRAKTGRPGRGFGTKWLKSATTMVGVQLLNE